MRAPDLLALWFVAATVGLPTTLRAQDPTDSLPTVEPADSLQDQDDGWTEEPDSTDDRERPPRRRGEGNPYLREVGERRASFPRRGPVWVGGSLGIGGEAIASLEAPSPYDRSRIAPTISFGIGGTVGQQLRLGVEGFVWFSPHSDNTVETVAAGMFTGRVYPLKSSGLFLKSGLGFGRYGQDVINDCGCSDVIAEDYGFAWMVGAGFEAPVSRGLWIGPTVEMVRMNVTGADGYRERVINVGISLTFDGKN